MHPRVIFPCLLKEEERKYKKEEKTDLKIRKIFK